MNTILNIIGLLLAIILHEMGHAAAALLLGDDTAKKAGRFHLHTHFDFWGSFVIPLGLYLLHAPFLIGYAKPVPVNVSKFKDPLIDFALVGLAGPATNFLLAFVAYIIVKFIGPNQFLIAFIITNLGLGFFNLIPIPPLDGSRLIMNFLSVRGLLFYERIERLGIFIIFVLQYVSTLVSKMVNANCSIFHIFVEAPVRYILNMMFR